MIKLRPYKRGDLPQIIMIFGSAYAKTPTNRTYTEKEMLKQIRFALSQRKKVILVAEDRNKIVGFIYGYLLSTTRFSDMKINRPANYLDNLAVKIRRMGIGRRLYQAYETEVKKQGMKSIVTWTTKVDRPAWRLYESEGFTVVKRRIHEIDGPSILYLKHL